MLTSMSLDLELSFHTDRRAARPSVLAPAKQPQRQRHGQWRWRFGAAVHSTEGQTVDAYFSSAESWLVS
jgi:hypothetical protein